MKKNIEAFLGLVIIITIFIGVYFVFGKIWNQFKLLDPKISIALLTIATTIIVSTLTVVLGKYYERKKDIESHYRDKKTKIYDEFLVEFFKLFHGQDEEDNGDIKANDDLTKFLQEWQRKMILWGGQDVVIKYIEWLSSLKKGNYTAQTFYLMEDFFFAIRKDLGHKNNKLKKGTFIHFILKNPEIFLELTKNNPNISLEKIEEAEEALLKS